MEEYSILFLDFYEFDEFFYFNSYIGFFCSNDLIVFLYNFQQLFLKLFRKIFKYINSLRNNL